MQPDNPVEQVTWWAAIEFANRLSIQHGYRPAYDTNEIVFHQGTSAEAGNLFPASREEGLKLKINAPNNDIYQAEGYRLPTEAEYGYVLSDLPHFERAYSEISDGELLHFGWFKVNSGGQTHPVGTTAKAFEINGHKFHDLIGNVFIWINDWHCHDPLGRTNPTGPGKGRFRVISSCSWNSTCLWRGHAAEPGMVWAGAGFRLFRTVRRR